jgi:hypothetical protein
MFRIQVTAQATRLWACLHAGSVLGGRSVVQSLKFPVASRAATGVPVVAVDAIVLESVVERLDVG